MQYMLLIYGDPSAAPHYDSPEGRAKLDEWRRYTQDLGASGALLGGDALQPIETATTVRGAGGEIVHTDGPFAETKEVLGGYYLIDVPDLDAALGWAARMPNISYGAVEVRPLAGFE